MTLDILGVADVDVKLLGPVQLKVAPVVPLAVRCSVCPVHTGLLLPTVGGDGWAVMLTVVVVGYDGHPLADVMRIH